MVELEPLEEKSNKRIDPRCEATSLYLSLYERAYALEFLHLLVEAENGVNNILKHQK